MRCSVARTLDVIGEWWTMLIMRDAFKGVTRFEDFHRNLGIARTVLSTRLDRLVEAGIFVRRQYSDHPPRSEYVLTEKGRDLFPVLVTLTQWGDRWAADDGPPRSRGSPSSAPRLPPATPSARRVASSPLAWCWLSRPPSSSPRPCRASPIPTATVEGGPKPSASAVPLPGSVSLADRWPAAG